MDASSSGRRRATPRGVQRRRPARSESYGIPTRVPSHCSRDDGGGRYPCALLPLSQPEQALCRGTSVAARLGVQSPIFWRIVDYVRPCWLRAAGVGACIVLAAVLNLAAPWFVKQVIDVAIPRGNLGLLWLYCLGMV